MKLLVNHLGEGNEVGETAVGHQKGGAGRESYRDAVVVLGEVYREGLVLVCGVIVIGRGGVGNYPKHIHTVKSLPALPYPHNNDNNN